MTTTPKKDQDYEALDDMTNRTTDQNETEADIENQIAITKGNAEQSEETLLASGNGHDVSPGQLK